MSDERDDSLGNWMINEDGSMDRLVPVPERVKRMAAERGVTLPPDHVPAEDVERYFPTKSSA